MWDAAAIWPAIWVTRHTPQREFVIQQVGDCPTHRGLRRFAALLGAAPLDDVVVDRRALFTPSREPLFRRRVLVVLFDEVEALVPRRCVDCADCDMTKSMRRRVT